MSGQVISSSGKVGLLDPTKPFVIVCGLMPLNSEITVRNDRTEAEMHTCVKSETDPLTFARTLSA